jgi:DNA-binding transcriptional ArsR family regulator
MINEERISKLTSAVYKVTDLFADKEPLKFAIRRVSLDVLSSFISYKGTSSLDQKKQLAKKGKVQSGIVLKYLDLASHQDWIDSRNFSILEDEYSEINEWFSEQVDIVQRNLDSRHVKGGGKRVEYPAQKVLLPELEEMPPERLANPPVTRAIPSGFLDKQALPEEIPSSVLQDSNISVSSGLIDSMDGGEIKLESVPYNIGASIDYEELSSTQLRILEVLQVKKFLKAGDICKYFEDTGERTIRREIKDLKDRGIIVTRGSGKSTFYQLSYVI